MFRTATLIASAWIALTTAVSAADRPVVVELYTSQGCSSCPPADAYFHDKLAGRDDVIALALHVDYWDYLGWKDEFASPANTKRQRDYARAAGHRTVYTPQMIIGGRDHVVGNHPYEVMDLIDAHMKSKAPVDLSIERNGNRVSINAETGQDLGPMVVQIVRYRPGAEVSIKRGENAGRVLRYANIVEDWDVVTEWDGKAPLKTKATARGDLPVVVLVQAEGHGPILAAARLR